MKILRYWSRKGLIAGYLAAAGLLTLLYTWQADMQSAGYLRMLPIIFGYLLLLRTADDCFDFEKDRGKKKQILNRRQLQIMFCVIGSMLLLLHLFAYKAAGICCIAAIGYLLLMNRIQVLKLPFMALLFVLYDLLNGTAFGKKQIAVCAGCLCISAVYAVVKRKAK